MQRVHHRLEDHDLEAVRDELVEARVASVLVEHRHPGRLNGLADAESAPRGSAVQ
jgi:hypothetical protein